MTIYGQWVPLTSVDDAQPTAVIEERSQCVTVIFVQKRTVCFFALLQLQNERLPRLTRGVSAVSAIPYSNVSTRSFRKGDAQRFPHCWHVLAELVQLQGGWASLEVLQKYYSKLNITKLKNTFLSSSLACSRQREAYAEDASCMPKRSRLRRNSSYCILYATLNNIKRIKCASGAKAVASEGCPLARHAAINGRKYGFLVDVGLNISQYLFKIDYDAILAVNYVC